MSDRVTALSDEELVRRFQRTSDKECFAELFERHRKMIYMACRGFFSDIAASEDATQETFIRAYRNIESFKGGDFAKWLRRIGRNVCIDEFRKRRLELQTVVPEFNEEALPVMAISSLEGRFAAEIWQEIRTLSPEQQRCLELKIEGYSYEETAARMGLSTDSVKSYLQNGRRMLWRRLADKLS
jgi:RNA polymerase sigma-70 factor (ECF subfamily)